MAMEIGVSARLNLLRFNAEAWGFASAEGRDFVVLRADASLLTAVGFRRGRESRRLGFLSERLVLEGIGDYDIPLSPTEAASEISVYWKGKKEAKFPVLSPDRTGELEGWSFASWETRRFTSPGAQLAIAEQKWLRLIEFA